jgi:two-component system chemotaxis response regulator CheB
MSSLHPDIVAIGASAGGIEAVCGLLRHLPPALPAAVLVAVHRPPERISHLQSVLARATAMRVVLPREGDRLQHGHCYVGTPGLHLVIGVGRRIHALHDSFYRGHCIDALFQSLARHAGAHTIGVILSGLLKDGTLGLKAIKECGGLAFVQSPSEAEYKEMPMNAIAHDGMIDFVGPVAAIAAEICRRTGTGFEAPASQSGAAE